MGQDRLTDTGLHSVGVPEHSLQLSSFPASQTTLGFSDADLGLGGSRKAVDTKDTIREFTAERVSDCSHGVIHVMGNRNAHPPD